VPFTAGSTSPSGIKPQSLPVKRAGAVFVGAWAFGAWAYPYPHVVVFHNVSRDNDTQSARLVCLCQKYEECGCDSNQNAGYVNDLVGNGSYAALNQSVVQVGRWKGQEALFVNGSLANGTTASSFATGTQSMLTHASWAVVGAALAYSFWLI
jgi:hypothetical protein